MVFSQKKSNHTIWVDTSVNMLYFNLNDVFNIVVHTTKTNKIKIKAHSEGEYANYFVINQKQTEKTIHIEGKIAFVFPDFQDKLSAHKVHSISVEIWVPEQLQVVLQSDIGNVTASGNYKSLLIDVASGNCYLQQIKGKISAFSVTGNVYLKTNSGVVVTQTNLGNVSVIKLPKSTSLYTLKTNKGDILVVKHP